MRNNETGEFELVVGNRQIMSGFFIVVLLFAVGVAMGYFLGQNSPRSAKMVSETSAAVPASTAEARPPAASPVQPPTKEAAPADSAAPAPATQPATQPVREPETAAPGAAPSIPEAAAGTYWQVMAVNKDDAEVVIRTLKNKGFPATLSPGTKGLTRVLVGPYADRAALGRAKADLETAGLSQGLYKIEITGDQGRK